MAFKAEYIWIDGTEPSPSLRSKTKVLADGSDLPIWGFDGSSTNQAPGANSDCVLRPVYSCPDPISGGDNKLVMCEVLLPDMSPHPTNNRAACAEVASKFENQESWFGIEQEFTLFEADGKQPLGFPEGGFPEAQGPYYCSVGANHNFGRDVSEAHATACIDAGIGIAGTNAEVMPGQWEFQVGPLGPLEVSDQLWLARWLLYRIGEDYEISATLDPKPVKGDWNGAGAHTNFSTKSMREPGGIKIIEEACEKLAKTHQEHINAYGADNDQRLTGMHETCSINEFRYGVSDRGASIRIPMATANDGYGYLEDRRPSANMDPYIVCTMLIETICAEKLVEA